MKKKVLSSMAILFVVFLAAVIYFLYFFDLFPVEEKLAASIRVNNCVVEFVSVYPGALSADFMNVCVIDSNDSRTFIDNIMGYRVVASLTVVSNNEVQAVLRRTVNSNSKYDSTYTLNLEDSLNKDKE